MINPEDIFVSAEQSQAIRAQYSDGKKKPTRAKRPRKAPHFFRWTPAFLRKLVDEKATPSVLAMIGALWEAWYASGYRSEHLNPFPLLAVDAKKWGLSKMQRSRALRFLVRVHLIQLECSDLKNPLVMIAWEDIRHIEG